MAQYIQEETIEEVRNRCDIVNVINDYLPLTKKGNDHWACCPFHNEKTPSFKVSSDYQSYYCFGCHASGNVFQFVMAKENVDFVGAVQLLARRSGVIIQDSAPKKAHGDTRKPGSKERIYEINQQLLEWYRKCLQSKDAKLAQDYLDERAIDEATRARFALGYAPDSWDATCAWGKRHGFTERTMLEAGILVSKEDNDRKRVYDRFRGRLIFPIWDELGRVVGFSGRTLDPTADRAKYINTPETGVFKKGHILYGLNLARRHLKEHGCALICEGQLDVIACHRAGLTNAVAPQGTAFTEAQARILRRFTDKVVFCFDADAAGLDAARKSLETAVMAELQAMVTLLPPEEDPDSIYRNQGAENLKQLVEQSQDGFDFLFSQTSQKHSPDTPEGKEYLVSTLLEIFAKIPQPVKRASLCQWLSQKTGVPETAVFDNLNSILRRQQKRNRGGDKSMFDRKPPQNSTAENAVFPRRNQQSLLENAKIHLLDLAVHHGPAAHKLAENELLTPSHLTNDPLDRALLLVLQKTTEDKWAQSGAALAGDESLMNDHRVARVLAESHYSHLTTVPDNENEKWKKDKQLQKVLDNCLLTIEKHEIDREINSLSKQLEDASDAAESRQLMAQYQNLARRKNRLQSQA